MRSAVYRAGLRFRTRNGDLPGSPDLANRRSGWAVFVHGCFWHRHRGCAKSGVPRRNRAYWLDKLARNEARDRRALLALRRLGFDVRVVWQCELASPTRRARVLDRLVSGLKAARART